MWAAMLLARTVDTCEAILAHHPVRCGTLNVGVLRRALRRPGLPDANTHIIVTPEHLAAINESGPIGNPDPQLHPGGVPTMIDGQLW